MIKSKIPMMWSCNGTRKELEAQLIKSTRIPTLTSRKGDKF
jgi:hypothetical protein